MRGGYAAELAVPIWARFMAGATSDDDPTWFRAPSNVVGVSVCRLSGKRALPGCETAEVADRDGNLTIKSQVYTEYFKAGTEPIDYCPIHGSHSFSNGTIATSGTGAAPAPQVTVTPLPAPPPAAVGEPARPEPSSAAAAEADAPTPAKKRGFWSRIFGRGDKDPDKKD
jgi:penicillin-binding protein 1A